MGYAAEKTLNDSDQFGQSFEQLYELYKGTISELKLYAKQVPGQDDLQDRQYRHQEELLIQVQEQVFRYAAIRPVQTLQDAKSLAALWELSIGPDGNDCSQLSNQLARKLMTFYQNYI